MRKGGKEDARGQPPSYTVRRKRLQSKKERKAYKIEKDKSPEAKGRWSNFRKAV